jgi:hypothetical protein
MIVPRRVTGVRKLNQLSLTATKFDAKTYLLQRTAVRQSPLQSGAVCADFEECAVEEKSKGGPKRRK